MSAPIALTAKEILMAATMGVARHVENVRKKRVNCLGVSPQGAWQVHVEGCLAEYAVAKFLGIFPRGMSDLGAEDLGYGIEVRRADKHTHRMILHPQDHDERRYVHVTGINGDYRVHGWAFGAEGKLAQYWDDPTGDRPAFFVPPAILHPMGELVELVGVHP